jgi:hypothetical protein
MSSSDKILGSHGGAYSGTNFLCHIVLSVDTNGSEESDPSTFRIKWHSSQAVVSADKSTQKTKMLRAAENVVTVGKWPT